MRDKITSLREMRQASNDFRGLSLGSRSIAETAFEDPDDKSERGRIQEMEEVHLDQGIQSIVRVLGRIAEGFKKNVDLALDLWIGYDISESLQATVRRCADFFVAVVEHVREWWDDIGKANCQLLRVEVGHGPQRIGGTLLASPLLLAEPFK